MSDVIAEIAAERRRQVEEEGWSAEHDDKHSKGAMARAAVCYAYCGGASETYRRAVSRGGPPSDWPWEAAWWKPATPRRDLIKAAALIVAEIERLDRRDPTP